jgi:branched-chain amino acid transport system permease protein
MQDIAQLLISGLATGAIYALIAMGFTLLWQTSGTINFAQGEFVMVPAFVMLAFMLLLGLPLWASFMLTLAVSALTLGFGFEFLIVRRMIRHGVLPLAIGTIGLTLALRQIVKITYSAEAQPFPYPMPVEVWHVFGVAVSSYDIGVLVAVGALVGGLQLFLARTMTGRAMQAVAQNPEAARVLGLDVERMIRLTFVINAVLATAAALLIAPVYLAKFDLGEVLGLKAFFAAIIGGLNQMRGALVGGLLLGVVENFAAAYVSAQYKDAVALALFVIVILYCPEGLVGRIEERKV